MKNKWGMHGIHYDPKRDTFQAFINDNNKKGKCYSRSCKKYGKEKALELVKEWRLQKQKEFGYGIYLCNKKKD